MLSEAKKLGEIAEKALKSANKAIKKANGGGCGNDDDDDPDKDKDKDKKDKTKAAAKAADEAKDRIYERNPKHGKTTQNNNPNKPIGAEPLNPLALLRRAVAGLKVGELVAIQNKKFVIFYEHLPNKYHGFVVEKWHQLTQMQKNSFYEAGLVKSGSAGKII